MERGRFGATRRHTGPRRQIATAAVKRRYRKSGLQEVLYVDPGLPQYGSERSLGHVSGMIWYRRVAIRPAVEPDFVAARGLPVELKTT